MSAFDSAINAHTAALADGASPDAFISAAQDAHDRATLAAMSETIPALALLNQLRAEQTLTDMDMAPADLERPSAAQDARDRAELAATSPLAAMLTLATAPGAVPAA